MARLPSFADLSGPVSLRSGRMYASADATAAGRGLSALGQGIEGLAEERRGRENTVDVARAEAKKEEGLIATKSEFVNDPDYATYGKRAPLKTNEVIANAGNLIRDPKMRERWLAAAQSDAARTNGAIFALGDARKKDTELIAFDDALETSRRIYVDPDTPDDVRAKAKKDIEGAIAMGGETGLLTPEAADARRKQYLQAAEFSRGKLAVERDPSIISHNRVSGSIPPEGAALLDTIAGTESGGAYNVLNGGERFSSFADHPRRIGKGGTATAAGRYQFVKGTWDRAAKALGLTDFSPESQDKAAWWLAQSDYAAKTGRDLLTDLRSPDENTKAGVRRALSSTWEGLKSLGDGKFASKIEAGPKANPDWYSAISPEQRAAIDQQAETRRNQLSAETRGNLEVVQQNAPAAIQNTGGYDGQLPTADDFFQAYGPQDGAQKYNAFQTAVETSKNVYDMRTMSSADIENMVKDAVPKSSGDGAALEAKRYEALSSAADSVLKSRASDPAAYVQKAFPSVDAAWNSVSDGVGYQAAVGASIAAQQQLGITDIKPLPKSVATDAVAAFKDEATPEGDRIGAISNVMMATPDPAQRRAIFDQLVKAGLPDTTEGAIEAMARGDAGAAQRLWAAALIDPSKLPGQIPGGLKPSDIDATIQSDIMDQGQIGDIYYGLTNGSSDNYLRAQRDSKLLNNAVNLRLRNGEVLSAAVEGAAKDLYGDVKTVNAGNAQILLPTDADPVPVLSGLTAQIPEVEKALKDAVPTSSGEKPSAGSKAVIDAVTQTHISNILAQGFFRNSGDGYVFIDPFSGSAVAGGDGKPMIFHPTPVDPKAAYESVSPVDILSGNDPVFGAR